VLEIINVALLWTCKHSVSMPRTMASVYKCVVSRVCL